MAKSHLSCVSDDKSNKMICQLCHLSNVFVQTLYPYATTVSRYFNSIYTGKLLKANNPKGAAYPIHKEVKKVKMKDKISGNQIRFWKSEFLNRDAELERIRAEIARTLDGNPYDAYVKSLKLAKERMK